MAREAVKARERKRERLVAKFAAKRLLYVLQNSPLQATVQVPDELGKTPHPYDDHGLMEKLERTA